MKIKKAYKLMLLLLVLPALLFEFGIEATHRRSRFHSKTHYKKTGATQTARVCMRGRYGRICRRRKVTPVVKTGTTTTSQTGTTKTTVTRGRHRRFGGWRRGYRSTTRASRGPGAVAPMM